MIELYCRATISSNLRDKEDRFNDTDRLKAVAMTSSHFGSTLVRLKAGHDASVFGRCLDGVTSRLNVPQKLARQALMYWLSDVCPACYGRKFIQNLGTPTLSDENCHFCHGTGLRPEPDGIKKILSMLDWNYQTATSDAVRKMKKE